MPPLNVNNPPSSLNVKPVSIKTAVTLQVLCKVFTLTMDTIKKEKLERKYY